MSIAVETAKRFAKSLDAEDYPAARAMIGDNCEYMCRGCVYHRPSAIIDAYRGTGDSAEREFDEVRYESTVTAAGDKSALIHFTDHLSHNNKQFSFECQQVIEVDDDGRITRIEHIDLPGQREGLSEFRQQIAISQSNDGNSG